MQAILDGLLAFFSAVGIVAVCYIFGHRKGRPVHRTKESAVYILLYTQGDGAQLQPIFMQLHRYGSPIVPQIILVDDGLNTKGQQAVAALMRQQPEIQCCTRETLPDILRSEKSPRES